MKPVSMKRFSITLPIEHEDQVILELGKLGVAQLIKEYALGSSKNTGNLEICEKYLDLQQKLSYLSTLNIFLEKTPQKKVASSQRAVEKLAPTIFKLSEVDQKVKELKPIVDELLLKAENLREEINSLKHVEERLRILGKSQINIGDIGDFKYIFLKVGLLNHAFCSKLERHLKDINIYYVIKPETREEDFVIISGPISYRAYIEEILTLLNFDEFKREEFKNLDPLKPLDSVQLLLKEKNVAAETLKKEADKIKDEISPFEETVNIALKVEDTRSVITRIGKFVLIQGWVPSDKIGLMRDVIENSTNKAAYINFEDPNIEEIVPTKLANSGGFKFFELFIRLAGTPNYFEIDPTPIFTILYVVMFGMMFGDMGGGLIFVVLGLFLSRMYKNFLGLSATTIRNLGKVVILCGLSSIVFGAFYGEFFLIEPFQPLILSPLHNQNEIMIIAIIFGVAQIALGLFLNIVNKLRSGHKWEAILSEKGLLGLAYYLTGIVLAIKFIESGMNLNAFADNMPLTSLAFGLLGMILLAPLMLSFIEREEKTIQKLLFGFSGFFETLISLLTNSISYVRLAAFALAHGAFALCAAILAGIMGDLPSYLLINVLVIIIEGMSVAIQSMRLMYYEFFTKFYSGTGKPYKPFSIHNYKT